MLSSTAITKQKERKLTVNQDDAKRIDDLIQEAISLVDKSIRIVMLGDNEPQFEEYRSAAGRIMAHMRFDLLEPIYQQYPDAKPESLKSYHQVESSED